MLLSRKHRKKIDLRRNNDSLDRCLILLTFGWAKTIGGMARTLDRGVERVRSRFILTLAASNLAGYHGCQEHEEKEDPSSEPRTRQLT